MLAGDPGRKLILLFVSQAERYFEVIVDRATHASAGEGIWQALASEFTRAVKTGPLGDALVAAVNRCGAATTTTPATARAEPHA